MAKKMTVAAINSAAKKTYTMREHNLTDVNGEIWSIAIDEKMNPVHIPKMCQDKQDNESVQQALGYQTLL